jgi:succinate dehydrogenase / fumarate reductase membrane anchor subunit
VEGVTVATTTTRSAPDHPAPRPDQRDRRLGRERPIGGVELWCWLFMRISGLLLLFLALGHLWVMHLGGTGSARIDFGFVAARWDNPLWRTWDWMLLMLALIHGINGLRNITLDYVKQAGLRFAINVTSYVIGFVLLVLGTLIVVTFDPSKWPGAT